MFTTGILIPHYNDIDGLRTTLESLDENLDIDVLIIDDGSDSSQFPTETFITSLKTLHSTCIRVESFAANQGIEAALNYGLDLFEKEEQVKYIMRIDSGDSCLNSRIKKQVEFLESNPGICLVGSQVEYVDENENYLFSLNLPLHHDQIKKYIHKAVPFIHSAVMFRKSVISSIGHYSLNYPAAEDYALFFKFIKHCRTANLPETLTRVVWNSKGISVVKRKRQLRSRLKLLIENARFDFNSLFGITRLLIIIMIPLPVLQFIKTSTRR